MFISKFKVSTGPKEWVFKNPDDGFEFKASSQDKLLAHIRQYREVNGQEELDFLESVVENYLCQLPMNSGACTRSKIKRGVFQYLQGGIALLKAVAFKSFTTQEEADRRSEICKDCSLNVFPNKTYFVKWSDRLALEAIGNRKSKYHDKLGTCSACSCPLRCKVFYPGKLDLKEEEKQKMRKANPACWQLEAK